MSSGHRVPFDNPVIEWVDQRLPLFTMLIHEYRQFPSPKNFNYFWNFGAIALVMLVTMILSGIFLAMHYTPHTAHAFDSVERIMRDVNYGWLIRYIHMNGASFFFVAVYIHIFRGFYYGSYKSPRELLWILGVIIFLLMMATAFMGYVLPWGQMSYWGATVITGFFTAFPIVGEGIQTWLLGGFAVDNATLNRFFSLHYLLPFVIFAVVFLHVWALHVTGSNNPLGIDVRGPQDTVPFHPYYTVKDTFGLIVFLMVYALFVFYFPNALGHPDNYIPADPMVTPTHIVPEWYFLPFYAILRAFTFGVNIYMLIGIGIAAAGLFPLYRRRNVSPVNLVGMLITAGIFMALGYFSQLEAEGGGMALSLPLAGFMFVTPKLCGVLAMFGSIVLLLLLPWLDWHPVRSARFRPLFRVFFALFALAFVVLGVVGANPAEGAWIYIGQAGMGFYFAFFLAILPWLSQNEKACPLPPSINDAVMKKCCKGHCGEAMA